MNVIALIIGGFLGSVSRYEVGKWIPTIENFQLATVLINLAGCLFLGWFFTIATKWKIRPDIRLGIGTGFTGAFTTFSTFSVQAADAISGKFLGTAVLYLLISVVGGLLMSFIGVAIGKKSLHKGGASK